MIYIYMFIFEHQYNILFSASSYFFMASELDSEKNDYGNKDENGYQWNKQTFPYDLYSSDNTWNIITQVQLKGENYDGWVRAIRGSLRARRKFQFVNESIEKPDDGTLEIDDWWTVNSIIVSWVFNMIEPKPRSIIIYTWRVRKNCGVILNIGFLFQKDLISND